MKPEIDNSAAPYTKLREGVINKDMSMEEEKKKNFEDFQRRWEFYVRTFEMAGFTREQAERLAQEFSKLITI